MARIFCIVGASCSGKDTIFNRLLELDKTLTPIVSYTTRPMRINERNGKEYYFVSKKVYNKLKQNDKILESRSYKTVHGTWIYFTANDSQIDIKSDKTYLMINTIEGACKLKDVYKNNFIVIHLCVEDRERLLRSLAREMNGNEDYVEMCRRFLSDTKDFDIERLEELGLNCISVINDSIPRCLDEVRDIIRLKK